MLFIARWKAALIVLTIVLAFVATIPNFFAAATVSSWPSWLPRSQVVLGLDLQGGAYLLYEVDRQDFMEKRLRTLTSDVRRAMLGTGDRIGYTGLGPQGQGVQLRVRDLDRLDEVSARLEDLRNPIDASLFSRGGRIFEFDLTVADDGLVRLTFTEDGLAERIRGIVQQSIEVIERRINELGTTEPSIQRQGDDRILVEAPGLGDPERLKALVGQTAQLAFHLVEQPIPAQAVDQTAPTPGTIRFPSVEGDIVYEVEDSPLMTGEDLTDASTQRDQTGEWVVSFRLSIGGARKFADVTQANVGRPFAIVLDDEVISAPVIREPILGGSGQISGNFTVESANDLAILLRAGALPAKLSIAEERTVGPGLGADSIRAGRTAAIIGTIAVAIYMIVTYGFFGVIANLALLVNIILVFAVITLSGATLTLPGIAGIVLTVGMAVDSNVLIYERIREEFQRGRTAISAIDIGFKRALGTIVDANITTFIAAATLFVLGTGPIRGFAVISMIGIITTVFTAFFFTRLLIATWVAWRRPTTVAI